MRKYLSFLFGLMIIFSLTGCSSKSEMTSTTASPEQIADNKISDAKVKADKKIADAKIIANKKIADAKIVADTKISDAKAKENTKISDKKATTLASLPETERFNQFIYKLYTNARYQYSIMYPNNLTMLEAPTNGDGRGFKSMDGEVELSIYGSNNISNDTVNSMYSSAIKNGNISYKKQFGNWYVISYIEGNKVAYEKTVVGKGSTNTFIFKYPINQKEKYSKAVEELNKSFKTFALDEAH